MVFNFKVEWKNLLLCLALFLLGSGISFIILVKNPERGFESSVEIFTGFYDVNKGFKIEPEEMLKLNLINKENLRLLVENELSNLNNLQLSKLLNNLEITKGQNHDSYVLKKRDFSKEESVRNLNLVVNALVNYSKKNNHKIYIPIFLKSTPFPTALMEFLFFFFTCPMGVVVYLIFKGNK